MSRRAVPIRPLNQRCYSRPLLVLIAVTKATRRCRRTHACTSMNARAATRCCVRNQVTAASFARTAASPAPRFSSSEARMTRYGCRRPRCHGLADCSAVSISAPWTIPARVRVLGQFSGSTKKIGFECRRSLNGTTLSNAVSVNVRRFVVVSQK
jgi:hypothetical protein